MTNEDMIHALNGGDLRAECVQIRHVVETTTLRDQFAMAALTGLVGNMWERSCLRTPEKGAICDDFAAVAYGLADAMLKARQEGKA